MECRLDPVSRPDEPTRSGIDMCYTPAEPELWWMRYTAPASDATLAAPVGDAGLPAPTSACPPEMVLVDGIYCPDVRHKCVRYLDEANAKGYLAKVRCAEFERNPECHAVREHRRFCIDRDEYAAPGATLPLADQSWMTSAELCQNLGKRLCFESEWEFACEGEAMLPYPYGFVRDAKLCNHDVEVLSARGKFRDRRVASESRPGCVSPFGARNMVGNVDEWVHRDGMAKPWRAALHGGWWLGGRNNCRAATVGHDEFYFGGQTGVRCCANAR
jgi:hypothetical protein